MTSDTPRTALCICILLLGGCAGESPAIESGSQCWDGKDNDGDGLIDCKDSDCGYLEICGQQPDQGVVPDKAVFPPLPDEGVPDMAPPPPPDQGPPDTAPASMYGKRCQHTGPPAKPCADGETICVPANPPSTDAFCTHKCPSLNQLDSCPATPDGQRAVCVFEYNHQPYCLFVCKFGGRNYECPSELTCEFAYPSQSHCY